MKVLKKKQSGFTLLEMSIVLFIISLLVLIMLPNLSQQRKHANSIHGKAMTSVIQTQIDAYENENGTDNVSLEELNKANYRDSGPPFTNYNSKFYKDASKTS